LFKIQPFKEVSGQAVFVVMLVWRKQFAPTLLKICTEFNKNSVCTSETGPRNFCNACSEM